MKLEELREIRRKLQEHECSWEEWSGSEDPRMIALVDKFGNPRGLLTNEEKDAAWLRTFFGE